MKINLQTRIVAPLALFVVSVIVVYFSQNIGIFWDNVLFVSKVGTFLYNNGILNWAAWPLDIDSGHPPFIGTYMALGWTVFGRSLLVSHLLMLPFVFGFLWQIFRFCSYFVTDNKNLLFLFLLVIVDPTLLSQLVLVNPEIIQLFFLFLALNGVLRQKSWQTIVGLAFLGVVGYRGMMLCAGVFLTDMALHNFVRKEKFVRFFGKRNLIIYLIGASPAIAYLTWRYFVRGWIFTNPLEVWGNYWAYASMADYFYTIARNLIVIMHRFLDFGRIVPFAFVAIALFVGRKTDLLKQNRALLLIFIFSTFVVSAVSVFAKNPMGHRYFIPSYIAMAVISFNVLQSIKYSKLIYVGIFVSLVAGNFIVYPDKFAQGWDSSLAHLPYWGLRKNAIQYLDENGVSMDETETFFPNYNSIDEIELNGDTRKMKDFSGKSNYVVYSNVYNVSDDVVDALKENYTIVQSFEKMNVRVEIFQKNDKN